MDEPDATHTRSLVNRPGDPGTLEYERAKMMREHQAGSEAYK